MRIEEDKLFLQREPGHQGCLVAVDKKLTERKEKKKEQVKTTKVNIFRERIDILNLA